MLSVPFPLRYLFATAPAVMGQVLDIVTRAIASHLIKAAGGHHATAHTGAVTLIQRFGSAQYTCSRLQHPHPSQRRSERTLAMTNPQRLAGNTTPRCCRPFAVQSTSEAQKQIEGNNVVQVIRDVGG